MNLLALREKDAGLDRLAPLLRDPDESVRAMAAELFGEYGTEARIAQLEAALTDRAKSLTAEQVKRDYSFKYGYAAIEKLRQRWRQPAGERVEAPPLPAPNSPSPSTPVSTATPAASSPAPTVAESLAPAVDHKSPVWPWLVGIAALTVIALLVWKRRV